MAKIEHITHMPKKYGGSETMIENIAAVSKHHHSMSHAIREEEGRFFETIIRNFEIHAGKQRDADILHSHFVFPAYFAQDAGLRSICSSHCLFSEEFVLAAKDAATEAERRELVEASRYFAELERKMYPEIENLLVHSQFHKAELERLGCDPIYIELPINLKRFQIQTSKAEARKLLGIPDKFTLLFLGRPTYLKGFSVLADAFLKLEGAQLLVVGDFELKDSSIEYMPCVNAGSSDKMRLFIGDNVFPMKPDDNKNIAKYFKAADVLVCPSFYESLGYVNLEAMAAGTLAIGSDSSGIPYVIKDGQTGLLFKTGDSDNLAAKISVAMHDRKLVSAMTENATDFVQSHDARQVVPRFDAVYDVVM